MQDERFKVFTHILIPVFPARYLTIVSSANLCSRWVPSGSWVDVTYYRHLPKKLVWRQHFRIFRPATFTLLSVELSATSDDPTKQCNVYIYSTFIFISLINLISYSSFCSNRTIIHYKIVAKCYIHNYKQLEYFEKNSCRVNSPSRKRSQVREEESRWMWNPHEQTTPNGIYNALTDKLHTGRVLYLYIYLALFDV